MVVDKSTGEILLKPEQRAEPDFEDMTDQQRWDKLQRLRKIRSAIYDQITGLETVWLRELQQEDATVKEIEGRGQVVLDKGTPVYDTETVSQLYTVLGKDTCDSNGRALISTKITEQKKVDGVRIKQLLKHGKHVKSIVDEAKSKAVQKSPRIKLVERK